jgi:hypothetical protein
MEHECQGFSVRIMIKTVPIYCVRVSGYAYLHHNCTVNAACERAQKEESCPESRMHHGQGFHAQWIPTRQAAKHQRTSDLSER